MKRNKWLYFKKVLTYSDWVRLILNRFTVDFYRKKHSRSFILFQFLEQHWKQNTHLSFKPGNVGCDQVLNGRTYRFWMRTYSSDPWVFRQIIQSNELEPVKTEINKRNLPMRYMLDAGANIGLATLYFKAFFPELQIIALEPDSENAKMFRSQVTANNLHDITLLQKGLWYKPAFLSTDSNSASKLEWGISFKETKEPGLHGAVEAVTIRQCMDMMKWPHIDYLKIDIEGAERELFDSDEHAKEILEDTSVISIEAHDSVTAGKIERMLKGNGFEVLFTGDLIVGFKNTTG